MYLHLMFIHLIYFFVFFLKTPTLTTTCRERKKKLQKKSNYLFDVIFCFNLQAISGNLFKKNIHYDKR